MDAPPAQKAVVVAKPPAAKVRLGEGGGGCAPGAPDLDRPPERRRLAQRVAKPAAEGKAAEGKVIYIGTWVMRQMQGAPLSRPAPCRPHPARFLRGADARRATRVLAARLHTGIRLSRSCGFSCRLFRPVRRGAPRAHVPQQEGALPRAAAPPLCSRPRRRGGRVTTPGSSSDTHRLRRLRRRRWTTTC